MVRAARHLVAAALLLAAACGVRPAADPLTDAALLEGDGARAGVAPAPRPALADGAVGGGAPSRFADASTSPGPLPPPTESACVRSVRVARSWAGRMPSSFPLFPGATLVEAGGTEDRCGLRVLSFRTARPPATLLNWYEVRARAAGYTAERETAGAERRLGGTRGDDAFVLFVQPDGGGSAAQLVANAGR